MALVGLIGWGSLMPAPAPASPGYTDKLVHLTAYTVLAGWWALGWRGAFWPLAIGVFGYGALLEVLQTLGGTRTGSWGDLAANGAGVAAGVLAAIPLRQRMRGSRRPDA
ncbi:MAG: VanZ family protein [Pseudomonadota bacterium]|nr:VanZ family protein [Pseudomonadota bacterium]